MSEPRTYLVVLDGSAEARVALRFAARRAARTGGAVEMLAILAPTEFVQWAGVQDAIEEEARLAADAMLAQAADETAEETGVIPTRSVRDGETVRAILSHIAARPGVAALVLGARDVAGDPGPLVLHFATAAGQMPCPVMVVPGGLDAAALDRLG